jgi:hypothetical protein
MYACKAAHDGHRGRPAQSQPRSNHDRHRSHCFEPTGRGRHDLSQRRINSALITHRGSCTCCFPRGMAAVANSTIAVRAQHSDRQAGTVNAGCQVLYRRAAACLLGAAGAHHQAANKCRHPEWPEPLRALPGRPSRHGGLCVRDNRSI